jgi:hypothetical protein
MPPARTAALRAAAAATLLAAARRLDGRTAARRPDSPPLPPDIRPASPLVRLGGRWWLRDSPEAIRPERPPSDVQLRP